LFVIAAVLLVIGIAIAIALSSSDEITRRERELLYHTDHAAVLAACREVFANQGKYRTNPAWNGMSPARTDLPDPADPNIPAAIKKLLPADIRIGRDNVRIELGGGFLHYGLIGYQPGAPGEGTLKLREGLWYYAEDGNVPSR